MDGWMDRRMDEWTNRRMNEWMCRASIDVIIDFRLEKIATSEKVAADATVRLNTVPSHRLPVSFPHPTPKFVQCINP